MLGEHGAAAAATSHIVPTGGVVPGACKDLDCVATTLERLPGQAQGIWRPRLAQPTPPPSASEPYKALVIVMEYCDSGTLAGAIRGHTFHEQQQPCESPKLP